MASQPGPYFFEEIGEKNKGKEVPSLGTPFSGGRNGGKWFRQVGAWPAASKTNASWPAHRLGRAGEVVCGGRKNGKSNGYSPPSPKGYPPTSPPAQPVGGPLRPFTVRAAGQVFHKKYSLPPHNPTREGSPEGRTSSLWGSFPHFFPRNGAPAGQAKVPCRFNGVGETPQRAPPVPTAQGQNTKNQPLPSPGTAGFLCVLASLTPPSSAQTPAGSPWRPSSRRAGSGWLQWPPQ